MIKNIEVDMSTETLEKAKSAIPVRGFLDIKDSNSSRRRACKAFLN
jgi:hypothetical protein